MLKHIPNLCFPFYHLPHFQSLVFDTLLPKHLIKSPLIPAQFMRPYQLALLILNVQSELLCFDPFFDGLAECLM